MNDDLKCGPCTDGLPCPHHPSHPVDRLDDQDVALIVMALDHYWTWFGDDCPCPAGGSPTKGCPICDGVAAARRALPAPEGDPDSTTRQDPDGDLLYEAWAIISNAGGWPNCPDMSPDGWAQAARRWRARFHERNQSRR